jgi:hypothetical protein
MIEKITDFIAPLLRQLSLFHWKDLVEIFFFSSIFYYSSLWLRRDRTKNLLFYFYAYGLVGIASYAFALETITLCLFLYAPVAAMIFLMLHQTQLQKNFITAQSITPPQQRRDWLSTLFQSLLGAVNSNKQIICVIEKFDSLKTVLDSNLSFNAEVDKGLLDILFTSDFFDHNKMILVNHHGSLLAINATWHSMVDEEWTTDIQNLETWKQDAFLLTNKTDALVLSIDPQTRTATLIAQKKFLENISLNEALLTIKQYLYGKASVPTYRGSYEVTQKHTRNQPLP